MTDSRENSTIQEKNIVRYPAQEKNNVYTNHIMQTRILTEKRLIQPCMGVDEGGEVPASVQGRCDPPQQCGVPRRYLRYGLPKSRIKWFIRNTKTVVDIWHFFSSHSGLFERPGVVGKWTAIGALHLENKPRKFWSSASSAANTDAHSREMLREVVPCGKRGWGRLWQPQSALVGGHRVKFQSRIGIDGQAGRRRMCLVFQGCSVWF